MCVTLENNCYDTGLLHTNCSYRWFQEYTQMVFHKQFGQAFFVLEIWLIDGEGQNSKVVKFVKM